MLGWLSDSARHAYPPNGMTSQAGERIVFRKLAVAVGYILAHIDFANTSTC